MEMYFEQRIRDPFSISRECMSRSTDNNLEAEVNVAFEVNCCDEDIR